MTVRRSVLELEQENAKLREDLFDAQLVLRALLSEAAQRVLATADQFETLDEFNRWRRQDMTNAVIAIADVKPPTSSQGWTVDPPRAYCPLCGEGTQSPGAPGFAVPVGLERHLLGDGRARSCGVLDVEVVRQRRRLRRGIP